MKKNSNYILGVAVALAMTVSGAFAVQNLTYINSLPYTITRPGSYQLHAPNFSGANGGLTYFGAPDYNNPSAAPAAIWIATNGLVDLDLNNMVIKCSGNGILVGPPPGQTAPGVTNVKVHDGVIQGTVQAPYYGLFIGAGCTYVTVSNVHFDGLFGFNSDDGAYSKITGCNFSGSLSLVSQGTADPGHGDYENLMLTPNWATQSNPANPVLWDLLGGSNTFSVISVTKGNVQLLPSDSGASSISVDQGYSVTGGTP
jgi:hypothetical protein